MERPEVDYELEIMRGETAARFRQDPYMQGLLKELDRTYYEAWKASTALEARELLYAKARALSDIEIALDAAVQAGTLARREMDAQRGK